MKRLLAALLISLTFTACRGADSDLPPEYRSVEVPEARLQSEAAISRGRALFLKNCAICHGETGDGRGRRSAGFAKPPTRFIDPEWRRRTTPRRVYFVVREGVRGTPMPSWRWLDEDDTWDLVAFVLSLAEPSQSRPTATLSPRAPTLRGPRSASS